MSRRIITWFFGIAALASALLVLSQPAQAIVAGTPIEAAPNGAVSLLRPSTDFGFASEQKARRDIRDSTRAYCTATMIDPQWVVTAAHCVYDRGVVQLPTVLAGKTDLRLRGDGGAVRRQAQIVVMNGDYRRRQTIESDIALIKLDRPINGFTPLPLAESNYVPTTGASVYVRGWGTNKAGAGGVSPILRQGMLTLASAEQATDRLGADFIPGQVLATNNAPDGIGNVCFGDSGGPLIDAASGALIGVTSFAEDDDCTSASGFTSIAFYHSWITRAQQLKPRVRSRSTVLIERTQTGRDLTCMDDFADLYGGIRPTAKIGFRWYADNKLLKSDEPYVTLTRALIGKHVSCEAYVELPGGSVSSRSRPIVPR